MNIAASHERCRAKVEKPRAVTIVRDSGIFRRLQEYCCMLWRLVKRQEWGLSGCGTRHLNETPDMSLLSHFELMNLRGRTKG